MRAAPSSDVPPNLNATISLRQQPNGTEALRFASARFSLSTDELLALLRDVVASPLENNTGTRRGDKSPSADDSDWTFLAFMVPLRLVSAGATLKEGFKEKTHRQVRFRRWV
jgi:hypothetical protein